MHDNNLTLHIELELLRSSIIKISESIMHTLWSEAYMRLLQHHQPHEI